MKIKIEDLTLKHNRGLSIGDVITEIRSSGAEYTFEITAVLSGEYMCEYVSDKPAHGRTFYWEVRDDLREGAVRYKM